MARGLIFIGFGVQIILGILWMCNALAGFESTGKGIVCVGQIVLLSAALYLFLQSTGFNRPGVICFTILSVLTFPMVMQCLMTADVRVLTAALLITETGCVLWQFSSGGSVKGRVSLTLAVVCWSAAGLIRAEFLWIGMIPMLFYMFSEKEDDRQKRLHVWRRILLTLATAGLIAGIGSLYRVPFDFTATLADRVAWTTLYLDYEKLSQEYKEHIDYWALVDSTYESTGVKEILLPSLAEHVGEEEARAVLKELSAIAWRDHRGRVIKEIAWDMAGYSAPALVVPLQLQGRAYDSYTGINYTQILQAAPRLGRYYMDYGCWWFAAALVLRAIVWLTKERAVEGRKFLLIGTTAVFGAFYYTMSGAGKMDYKNTLFVSCIWYVWLASAIPQNAAEGGEESK